MRILGFQIISESFGDADCRCTGRHFPIWITLGIHSRLSIFDNNFRDCRDWVDPATIAPTYARTLGCREKVQIHIYPPIGAVSLPFRRQQASGGQHLFWLGQMRCKVLFQHKLVCVALTHAHARNHTPAAETDTGKNWPNNNELRILNISCTRQR